MRHMAMRAGMAAAQQSPLVIEAAKNIGRRTKRFFVHCQGRRSRMASFMVS
jgi:peptide subunit release factor RF-3